jgi:hypothetical protein
VTVSQDENGAAAPLLTLGEHLRDGLLRECDETTSDQSSSDCDDEVASYDRKRAERAVGDGRDTVVRERLRAAPDEVTHGGEPIAARALDRGDLPDLTMDVTPRRPPRPGADASTEERERRTTALERDLARLNRAVAGMVRAEAARGRDDPAREGGSP